MLDHVLFLELRPAILLQVYIVRDPKLFVCILSRKLWTE